MVTAVLQTIRMRPLKSEPWQCSWTKTRTRVCWRGRARKPDAVVRSVLAGETIAKCGALDLGLFLVDAFRRSGLNVEVELVSDSKSLFDAVVFRKFPSEKRLLVDLAVLRSALEKRKSALSGGAIARRTRPMDSQRKRTAPSYSILPLSISTTMSPWRIELSRCAIRIHVLSFPPRAAQS